MSRSTRLKRVTGNTLDWILSELFYPSCVDCGKFTSAGALCEGCSKFQPLETPWCDRCGEPSEMAIDRCGECRLKTSRLTKVRSLWRLNPSAQALLHWVKYDGNPESLARLHSQFARDFKSSLPNDLVIVPVPIDTNRWFKRSFNQAEVIAHWLGTRICAPVLVGALIKARATAPQSTLRKSERRKNLQGGFKWNPQRPAPPKMLLVDDVYTTGSTLEACAATLRGVGCREVYGWTLFRTPKSAPRAESSLLRPSQ